MYKPVKKQLSTKLIAIATFLVTFLLIGSIFGIGVFTYLSKDLPSPNELTDRPQELSTKIYDRNGVLLYDVYDLKNRTIVSLDKISPFVLQATLATEDSEFYRHHGFDVMAYIRAVRNIVLRRGLQGGSTLTQQLVKNALLTNERTIIRKIKELVLTLQIENKYSKDQILQMYLNETPYGSTAWGVESASELFFGKPASGLDLAESALIAGLPQSPTSYSPINNPDVAIKRQQYVLKLMKEKGWITAKGTREFILASDYETALKKELVFASGQAVLKAPHFVMYVRGKLIDTFGIDMVETGGLKVTTTLDYALQEKAQTALTESVAKEAYLKVGNASLVALNSKTGEILGMVGSKDFFNSKDDGQVNVSLSLRQPGSAIKPITYATALKMGYTASFPVIDAETDFNEDPEAPEYIPGNYDGTFRGPVQFRYALAQSINVPAVKFLKLVGINNMVKTANEMGISTLVYDPKYYGLALTLGGGEIKLIELTSSYTVFANNGVYNFPYGIEKVEDNKGNVLFSHRSEPEKVLDPAIAFIISNILSDNDARAPVFGYGSYLNIAKHTVAVKTGTTNDKKDNWTIGFTPTITVGVWAGNNDGSQMHETLSSGVTGAAPIWNKVMTDYLKDTVDEKFVQPETVIKSEVGTITGFKPYTELEKSRMEYFIKGTEPVGYSLWVTVLEICKEDNKIANKSCIDDDRSETVALLKLKAELPQWQDYVDHWVENAVEKDSDKYGVYDVPSETSDY